MRFLQFIATIFFLNCGSAVVAEDFSFRKEAHGMVLEIKQTYRTNGVSEPSIAINGAPIRYFSDMQNISIAFDGTLENEEAVLIVHHWEGGAGCEGALTIFSLSDTGFFQSRPIADCAAHFAAKVSFNDPAELLILTYEDEGKTREALSWRYLFGQVLEN